MLQVTLGFSHKQISTHRPKEKTVPTNGKKHFVNPPQPKVIHSIHMYGWKNGLKTGSYYIRTKSVLETQNYSTQVSNETGPKDCLMCSA